MELRFYGVKDDVTGEFVFTYLSLNEGTMKRVVKSAMLGKEPNVFTTNMKDKKIFDLGCFDTFTGILTENNPVFVCGVSQLRLELINEIKQAKQEEGIEEPDANEVQDEN